MSAEGKSLTDLGLPRQVETQPQKTMRAHLRYLRHEVRTPINAIVGYGEMLSEECPPALLPTVIADIGRLLVSARHMTQVSAEILSQVDGDPQLERRHYHSITATLAEALSPALADCMRSCEQLTASVRAHGDAGEFSADLFKISSGCQHLFSFLAAPPTPQAQPCESPASAVTAVDPTGAFAIAQSVHPRGSPGVSSEPALSVILVVDDSAANRTLLQRRLTRHGYRVEEAQDGTSALARLAIGGIDLVLLDVLLPDIDGLTLCRTLKGNPLTTAIPVLLVTALHERQDRLAGIAAGANDFLSKPIDSQDLLLRCRNALVAKRHYDQTVAAYRKLQQLEELRDRLTHLIVHDMRSPLSGLIGYLDLFSVRSPGQVDERLRHLVEKATLQAHSLEGLINHVLDVSRLEAGAMPLNRQRHDLVHLARMAVAALGSAVERVPVRIMAPASGLSVVGDGDLIRRVYINLLSNALRYAPDGSEVVLSLSLSDKVLRSEVLDDGPGIALENQQRIFEKFNQVKTVPVVGKSVTSGLGLTFCKLAIEAHDGSIGVQSTFGQGSLFWFTLPEGEEKTIATP